MSQNKRKRCDASQLKKGDWLSRESYVQILGNKSDGMYRVRNEDGYEWSISPNILEQECYAAEQWTKTKEVTATELAKIFKNVGQRVFLVEFHLQPSVSSVEETLAGLSDGELSTKRKRQRVAKELIAGRNRRLVGHLIKHEPKMGRSMVRDLEIEEGKNNVRLVDHRHIERLVVGGTEYVHRK